MHVWIFLEPVSSITVPSDELNLDLKTADQALIFSYLVTNSSTEV